MNGRSKIFSLRKERTSKASDLGNCSLNEKAQNRAPISYGIRQICILCSLVVLVSGCVINFKNPIPQTKGIIHVDTHYQYPGKNEFSTYDKFYKKEVSAGRYAQAKDAELDPSQQLLVLNKALIYHFFDMPDTFYHWNASNQRISGTEPQFIRISADTLDRTVYWSGSLDSLHPAGHRLKDLVEYVDSIVKSTDAYKSLPN